MVSRRHRSPGTIPRRAIRLAALLRLAAGAAIAVGAPASAGPAAPPHDFVAFLPDPTADATYLEMLDSFEAYATYMRATGVGEFRVQYFTKLSEFVAFLQQARAAGRPPTVGVVHSLLALQKAREWGLHPIACPVYEGSTVTRQIVVAPRSNPARSVRELAGQRLAVVKLWSETPDLLGLTLFGEELAPGSVFSGLVTTESLNECLEAVMRRDADAAMVNEAFFAVAQRRNRGVWKELKVIEELAPQHIAPIVAFDEAPAALVETIKAVIFSSPETDDGRHLLDVFNLDGFEACGEAELQAVEGKLLAHLSSSAKPAPEERPAPPASPALPGAVPESGPEIEVERDWDSGELVVSARFRGDPPPGLVVRLSLDGAPAEEIRATCEDALCMAALPASRLAGKRQLTVELVLATGEQLGATRTYPIPSRSDR